MHQLILILAAFAVPLVATAQNYSAAPMLVITGGQPAEAESEMAPAADAPTTVSPDALMENFPKDAVTTVGPDAQPPTAPAAPPADAAKPVSKLWPRDTVKVFMPSCVGYHRQMIRPCRCTIDALMTEMTHDEFVAKSENNTIEQDPRLQRIRTECATAPQKKE